MGLTPLIYPLIYPFNLPGVVDFEDFALFASQ